MSSTNPQSPYKLPDAILGAIKALPIAAVASQVCNALQSGNVLLSAEPGAGKSTGLPLALLQAASPENKIIMLEPRRLAAIGVANRLASVLNEPLGKTIGLRMRGQTTVSKDTVLEVVTEGVLTRLLQSDPTLENIGWVIFDEFHERSLHADLGLALCLDVQQSIRENLRLLLMSATLDMDNLSDALGQVEQITCQGRQHPVEIRWVNSVGARQNQSGGNARAGSVSTNQNRASQIGSVVLNALRDDEGDILVFLPGVAEISRVANVLQPHISDASVQVLQLHGRASSHDQSLATAKAVEGTRRIILSTSIAETSITIDGVRVVIDAGLERRARVNHHSGSQQLETVTASQASATQRAGRAGRTSSGVCYRLWSEHDHARRARSWQPEILRAELATLVVEIGLWGANDIQALPWLVQPPTAAIGAAEKLLSALGMWRDGKLTSHGSNAAHLPVHPRLAHMLLWANEHGVLDTAIKLSVLLEEGSIRTPDSDIENVLKQSLNRHQQQRAAQLRKRVESISTKKTTTHFKNDDVKSDDIRPSVGVLLAQAFPDNIAQRRQGEDARYALAGGTGAQLDNDDTLAQQPWLCIASMGGAKTEARIFLASSVSISELQNWSTELFSNVKHIAWDDKAERVVAEKQVCIGSVVVSSSVITNVSDEDTALALIQGIRKRGIDCLPWTDDCRQWQARVQLMSTLNGSNQRESKHNNDKENDNDNDNDWPQVDDADLLNNLENWLVVWLTGVRSFKALSKIDLLAILKSMLNYRQQQLLEASLPQRFTVPSGSNIKLRYSQNEPPVLSVKLQEMFGCQVNPSVAQGKVALKVELLSPARRPVQVTTDLANFWTNSYPAVKKDMAGRYPKHNWPDDPLSAVPSAFAKRRKS